VDPYRPFPLDTLQRRLKPPGDGSTLTVEVIDLAPARKTETLTFIRQ
jgi:hypothetical protein